MVSCEWVKADVVTACVFVAATCLFVAQTYRRRRQREGSAGRRRYSEVEDKPQNYFKCVLAGNSYVPFKHFKREGKEKEISLKIHPYEEEISFLLEHPPLIKFCSNHPNSDMGNSYSWINTEHLLESLAETLRTEKVFAVDTEQHSLRSFLGFTALMQVFHGADNDVLWLQRDFHIYVVNMFDTAKACEVLSKPQKSLAFLLEAYCGVLTDKSLQREDWRQRPLSAEMIQYARTDAHYLLCIADCLASELRTAGLVGGQTRFACNFM